MSQDVKEFISATAAHDPVLASRKASEFLPIAKAAQARFEAVELEESAAKAELKALGETRQHYAAMSDAAQRELTEAEQELHTQVHALRDACDVDSQLPRLVALRERAQFAQRGVDRCILLAWKGQIALAEIAVRLHRTGADRLYVTAELSRAKINAKLGDAIGEAGSLSFIDQRSVELMQAARIEEQRAVGAESTLAEMRQQFARWQAQFTPKF